MKHLKLLLALLFFVPLLTFGQANDPAVVNPGITPAPLPFPSVGGELYTLRFNNNGFLPIDVVPGDDLELRITLNKSELTGNILHPASNDTDPTTGNITGPGSTFFDWQYTDLGTSRSIRGTLRQQVPAFIALELEFHIQVTEPSSTNTVGFNANIVPSFTVASNGNNLGNDAASIFTSALCDLPLLSAGNVSCEPGTGTYSVEITTNSTNVTVSPSGTVDLANNIITGINVGDTVTITAGNGAGCETSIVVDGPDTCPPTNCNEPDLVVGQGVCDGVGSGFYTVTFSETTGATITVVGGTDNTDGTATAAIGSDMTITASNGGDCEVSITVTSPDNCDEICEITPISLGGAVCATDGSAFYTVSYTAIPGATITTDSGTAIVGPDSITNITSGVDITITVSIPGCDDTVVTVPAADCPECSLPVISAGDVTCDAAAGTYSISFFTDADTVTPTAGTVDMANGIITDIPLGTDVTITASNGAGCETNIDVEGPDTCPTNCAMPDLFAGQAVCDGVGAGTFTFNFSENTGATITVVGGIDNTDGTVSGTIGTPVTITASNGGDCEVSITVESPANCDDICSLAPVSLSAATCSSDGSGNYEIAFTLIPGATIASDFGNINVGAGMITDIDAGQDVTITVSVPGCSDTVIVVPAPSCSDLGISFIISDAIVNGLEPQTYFVRVRELLGNNTDDNLDIVVRMDKIQNLPDDLSGDYDPTATMIIVGGFPETIDNAAWEYDSSDPAFHIWRNTGVINANTTSAFGFVTNFDPGATEGQVALTVTILPNSGGESNPSNNIDAFRTDFFEE